MERLPLIGGTTLTGQATTTQLPDPPTPMTSIQRLWLRLASQVIVDDLLDNELKRRIREREEQELRRAS